MVVAQAGHFLLEEGILLQKSRSPRWAVGSPVQIQVKSSKSSLGATARESRNRCSNASVAASVPLSADVLAETSTEKHKLPSDR